MEENTNILRRKRHPEAMIDDKDRKLLGLLSEDSSVSYVELGKQIHLSAPAVHERVKRLKADGVIERNTVKLNGSKIGRPFLAFIHVSLTGLGGRDRYATLAEHRDVEEIHSVAGDSCLLLKVRCQDASSLEDLLAQIRKPGDVTSTRSHVVLSSYLERGPQANLE